MRRVKKLGWAFLALSLLIAASHRGWERWVFSVGAGFAGARFERLERVGERRVFHGVGWSREGVAFEAQKVSVRSPWRWLFTRKAGVEVVGWRLVISDREASPAGEAAWSGATLGDQLKKTGEGVARWLGSAELTGGQIEGKEGELKVDVERVRLNGETLSGTVGWRGERVAWTLGWAEGTKVELNAVERRVVLTAEAGEGGGWSGQLNWEENESIWSVAWAEGAGGWRPRAWQWQGEDWVVSPERVGLAEVYQEVKGGFRVEGTGAGGRMVAEARAEGREGAGVPAVRVEVEAAGDGTGVEVSRLEVEAPYAGASLSAPWRWEWAGAWAGAKPESELVWWVDLGEWGGAGELAGRLEGRVDVRAEGEESWKMELEAEAKGLRLGERGLPEATLRAGVSWPWVVVEGVRLKGTETRLEAGGRWHAEERRLEAGWVKGEVVGAEWAAWWPEGWAVDRVDGEAEIAGGGAAGWRHEGRLAFAGLRRGEAGPVAGATQWRGTAEEVEFWETEVGLAGVEVAGAGRVTANGVGLTALAVTGRDGRAWTNRGVMEVRRTDAGWEAGPWRLEAEGGGVVALEVAGGRAVVRVEQVDTELVRGWWPTVPGEWRVKEAQVEATWEGAGAMVYAGWLRGEVATAVGAVTARFEVEGDGMGSQFRLVEEVVEGQGALGEVSGKVGVTLHAEGEEWWRWNEAAPLGLKLEVGEEARLWRDLAGWAGVKVDGMDVRGELSGTGAEPTGWLEVRLSRLERVEVREGRVWPRLEGAVLRLRGDGDGVDVLELGAKVDGQAVSGRGRMDWAKGDWRRWREDPLELLRERAEGSIQLSDTRVAALARYLPTYLAPVGEISAELTLSKGVGVTGRVRLAGAATRPLGPLGVWQEVGADLRFEGDVMRVESVRARAGGRPVELTGQVGWRPGMEARMDLALKGENIRLVTQAGVVVRGDVDLQMKTNEATGVTRIGGAVRLRDSLVLVDLRSLLPTAAGARTASRRLPFFSIEHEPLARWELGVAIQGERFLRLRTPVFDGVASARMRLGGTLRDPLLTGEATLVEGVVIFPFARLAVREGGVRVTADAPYEAKLFAAATGRRMGYDLTMELSGTAEAPRLQFFSSPPLDSEAILLMVAAGRMPTDEGAYTTGQRAARLGTFLGRDLLRSLGVGGGRGGSVDDHDGGDGVAAREGDLWV